MRYDIRTKDPEALKMARRVQVKQPGTHEVIDFAVACDTDEGWYEQYETIEKHGRRGPKVTPWTVMPDGRRTREILPPVRVYAPFDVVDRVTGMTLHQVRKSQG